MVMYSTMAPSHPFSLPEPSHMGDMDDSISAAIAVRASVEDFRFSANVAQVMGNTK